MKEIGGYFEMEKMAGKEYHKNCHRFNTGRNCLRYVIKKRKIETIYLPYYLCDSVEDVCKKEDINISYYNINENFLPDVSYENISNGHIYIVNFYGVLSNKKIKQISNLYKNIIVDNTHSFFQNPISGIDTIFNCRKYFGVPDGAYLYTNLELDKDIQKDKSKDRFAHLLGRFESSATLFYEDFVKTDKAFKELDIHLMSDITHNILKGINYKAAKLRRRENFKILKNELKGINKIELSRDYIGTYMFPFLAKDGAKLREFLIKNKIYVPLLWPNVLEIQELNSTEYDFINNIVPLPIDQRYDCSDMNYIIKLIKNFYRSEK